MIKDEHYNWQLWLTANPPPPPVLTSGQLFEEARRRLRQRIEGAGKKYLEPEGLLTLLRILAEYFANDPAFEERYVTRKSGEKLHYSLRKGLLLLGRTGRAKSTFFELFKKTARGVIVVEPCRDVVSFFEEKETGGRSGLLKRYGRAGAFGWCFDDIGDEPLKAQHMGNWLDVMDNVLEQRYRLFDTGLITGMDTHLTTNLRLSRPDDKPDDPPGLLEHYGPRIFSRFQAMFNPITVPQDVPDFRTL